MTMRKKYLKRGIKWKALKKEAVKKLDAIGNNTQVLQQIL